MNRVQVYQELAVAHDQQGQAQVRDRYLLLAADAALAAGRADEADALRARLLQMNPHHLLKPFASLAQALESPDVKTYVEGLRRTYPPEEAEQILRKLKKEPTAAPSRPAPPSPSPAPPAPPPRSGPSSPLWQEVKQQPLTPPPTLSKVVEPTTTPAVPIVLAPPARVPEPPPPAPPPPAPPPATLPELAEPIPFAPEPAPAPRNTRVYPTPQATVADAGVAADEADREGDSAEGGSWLASVLFYVVLLGSLALGAYTLWRPFR